MRALPGGAALLFIVRMDKASAKAAGLKFYSTGKPCKYGHVPERLVSTGQCRECERLRGVARTVAKGGLPIAEYRRRQEEWRRSPEWREQQRAKWRASYRRLNGARPLEEIRAEQAAKRSSKLAAREAARVPRKPGKSLQEKRSAEKAWRTANRDRMRELKRSWKKANPAKVRLHRNSSAQNHRRRAWLMKKQHGRCPICERKLAGELHIDHIMPVSLGGPNRRSNLQLTHAACNMAKLDHHPIDHAQSLGRLL